MLRPIFTLVVSAQVFHLGPPRLIRDKNLLLQQMCKDSHSKYLLKFKLITQSTYSPFIKYNQNNALPFYRSTQQIQMCVCVCVYIFRQSQPLLPIANHMSHVNPKNHSVETVYCVLLAIDCCLIFIACCQVVGGQRELSQENGQMHNKFGQH